MSGNRKESIISEYQSFTHLTYSKNKVREFNFHEQIELCSYPGVQRHPVAAPQKGHGCCGMHRGCLKLKHIIPAPLLTTTPTHSIHRWSVPSSGCPTERAWLLWLVQRLLRTQSVSLRLDGLPTRTSSSGTSR